MNNIHRDVGISGTTGTQVKDGGMLGYRSGGRGGPRPRSNE